MKTEAKNKSRVINPKGYTMDIVKAVVDVYDTSRTTIPDELICCCSDSDEEACFFIAQWVDDNISYKKDPEGEQWIKTPARLISDGEGDCKSFSILICAFLTEIGIPNKFRFVSYRGQDYTHVYPVAELYGREFPIDVVALKQQGLPIGQELKYKKKYDRMNSTRISELSGVDGMSIQLSNDISVAELVAESASLVAMVQLRTGIYWKYQLLREAIKKYQTNEDNMRLACYMWLSEGGRRFNDYPQRGIPSWSARLGNMEGCVRAQNKPNSGYEIDESLFNSPEFKEQWQWLEDNIFPYLNKYKKDTENVKVARDLLEVGMNGMYLFIHDSYLNSTQKQKKTNQNVFLEMLVGNTAFTETSAKYFVYAGFLSTYRCTPQSCFNAMFGKSIPSDYSSFIGEDDDWCGHIEYNDNYIEVQKAEVVSTPEIKDSVGGWIDQAVGWFTSIWKTVTGNSSGGNNYRKLTPSISDGGSTTGWLLVAGLAVLGLFLLKRRKR